MVQYCYCLFFLNSKALVLFQYPFKNYRLINRYRPVWSNLAIGIGKIHYWSTSSKKVEISDLLILCSV